MKKLFVGGLSVLLASTAFAPSAMAELKQEQTEETRIAQFTERLRDREMSLMMQMMMMEMMMMEFNVPMTEAFSLVRSAYGGEYTEQGIPAFAQFAEGVRSGEIDSDSLVQAAVASGDLAPEAAEDETYLGAVDLQLRNLALVMSR
ncbi:MAG: hypothetical protein ACFB4I_10520 [Cyanophyceae cyanobacterium]